MMVQVLVFRRLIQNGCKIDLYNPQIITITGNQLCQKGITYKTLISMH